MATTGKRLVSGWACMEWGDPAGGAGGAVTGAPVLQCLHFYLYCVACLWITGVAFHLSVTPDLPSCLPAGPLTLLPASLPVDPLTFLPACLLAL